MKLYIIAGEASGDLHGSNLLKAIKSVAPDTQCRVWGGDMMQAAGGELVKHYREFEDDIAQYCFLQRRYCAFSTRYCGVYRLSRL
jgi:Lipid-A-disaccharide synthetase